MIKTTFAMLVADGHEPAPLIDIDGTIFVHFGLFLLLLFVLTRFVFRPYLALLRERDENIDGARARAREMSQRATDDLESYEDQVIKARKEAATVRAGFREEGERAAAELLAEARARSEAKVAAARTRLHKSADAARLALRTRADGIAQDIATKLLGREV